MSVTFLILKQPITYLHHICSSELQIFILVFQKKKNCEGFIFGMKTCVSKLSSWWPNLEQIFQQAHFDEATIFDHFIINVAIRGKNTSFLNCRNDE